MCVCVCVCMCVCVLLCLLMILKPSRQSIFEYSWLRHVLVLH